MDNGTASPEAEQLLGELREVSAQLAAVEAQRTELYDRRLTLYKRGRGMAPPLTNRVLAAATGVTEEAVIQALRKDERQRQAREARTA